MRHLALLALAPLLMAATPPLVPTPPGADCPAREATDKVLALVPGVTAADEDFAAFLEVARAISTKCAKASKLDPFRHDKYHDYTAYALAQLAAAQRLGQAGIPLDAIDQALDLGPGRSNLERRSFSQAEVDRITAALQARGMRTEQLDEATWQKIGLYAIFTAGVQRKKFQY